MAAVKLEQEIDRDAGRTAHNVAARTGRKHIIGRLPTQYTFARTADAALRITCLLCGAYCLPGKKDDKFVRADCTNLDPQQRERAFQSALADHRRLRDELRSRVENMVGD